MHVVVFRWVSVLYVLCDLHLHEEQDEDEEGRDDGCEDDPDLHGFVDAHRVDEPASLAGGRRAQAVGHLQLLQTQEGRNCFI